MLIQKAHSADKRDVGDCLLGEAPLDGFLLGKMECGENTLQFGKITSIFGEITTESGEKAAPERNVLFGFYVFRRLSLFYLDIVDQEAFLFINAEVVALVVD